MASVASLANAGSVYEQLIAQVIAVESQPRLRLRAAQTDQSVYKGVLSDFSSRVSSLDTVLDRFSDPFRTPFAGKSATVGSGGGFTASAADGASPGRHEVEVRQLARADARLSKRFDNAGSSLGALFVDPGDPDGSPPTPDSMGERSFTIQIAQPDADPVDLAVRYTPAEGATDAEIMAGIASAVNDAMSTAEADGLLAAGTGASASVVSETSGTSRLSLRGTATGFANRLTFSDPDGILAALEVDRETVRSGTGGGAVYAVGTGAEDSGLSAALTIDGLDLYRDSNSIDDALAGVTLSLTGVSADGPVSLGVGVDGKGIRSEIEAFVKAYNGLSGFVRTKSAVDADTGTRGVFASDSAVRGLRSSLRTDIAQATGEAGGVSRSLADIGITAERDGTLVIDTAVLTAALEASPDAVGALFSGEDGVASRISARTEGLTGATGTIAQRRESADARIARLDTQIDRMDARLQRREDSLRAQFALLQDISTRAQSQQASLSSLFFF